MIDFKPFIRQTLVALLTAGVILVILVVGFRGQQQEEDRVAQQTLEANLAIACVLALPVDERGRDPRDVKSCFTQYNLPAPEGLRP